MVPSVEPPAKLGLDEWLRWALVAATGLCFAPVLWADANTWVTTGTLENRSIAFLASAYLISQKKWPTPAPATALDLAAGTALLAVALLLVQVGSLSLQSFALWLALPAVLLLGWGRQAVVQLARPLAIMAMALLVSGVSGGLLPRYTPVVQWLQYLVAGVAGYLLWVTGYAIQLQQTVLLVPGSGGVDVTAGCSGVYSVLEVAVLALTAVLTISKRTWSANLRYVLACVGIALGLNLLRVLMLVLSSVHFPESFHALHEGWGASLYGTGISVAVTLFTSWYFQWNPFDPPASA